MGLKAQWLAGPQAVLISDNHSTLKTSLAWEDPRAHPSCEPALGPGGLLPALTFLCSVPPQISPQIYQSLQFNELAPAYQPDFKMHKALDQKGWFANLVTRNIRKDADPDKETMFDTMASMPTFTISPSSLFSTSASGSRFLASVSTSPRLQSSLSFQRP